MKTNKTVFLIVSLLIIGVSLSALQFLIGVQTTGPGWAQALNFILTGMAGVALWEIYGSLQ